MRREMAEKWSKTQENDVLNKLTVFYFYNKKLFYIFAVDMDDIPLDCNCLILIIMMLCLLVSQHIFMFFPEPFKNQKLIWD